MKIGIFTDTYLPDINGVVSSVELLRKQLEKHGHDAYVICTYKGVSKVKKEGKIIRLPGVEVKKLYGYALASPLHFLYIEELRELNLDLIHAETEFGVGIFANIVASTLNLPLVRTYHTTYEDYTHYVNFINSKTLDKGLKKVVASVSKLYCNNCVKLITPSKKTMDMLISYGVTTPIDIIPTGIELDRFNKDNIDQNKVREIRDSLNLNGFKLLTFVGRIAEEKSIDSIIKAFKKVKENNIKVKLLIVGAGPSLDDLMKLSNDLSLDDYITFVGKKPFEEVPYYYSASDGFISASTSETQGMTYIEALASGLVVLAHYDEVLTDIVTPNYNGYFFNSTNEIYDAILKFDSLSQDGLNSMKQNCIDSVKNYDADKFGKNSIKLYEDAIEDYKHSYILEKTSLKDDCVALTFKDFNNIENKLVVSLDTYYELGLRKASRLSQLNFNLLKQFEVYALAYKSCLKKLSNRDYSVCEMREYIKSKFDLSDAGINVIIEKLLSKNLLDDYRYALNKVSGFSSNFYSKNTMRRKLQSVGINNEIIDKVLIIDKESELLNAKRLANKYLNTINNKSLNAKKQTIYAKLINAGFTGDVASEAMSILDFSNSTLQEKDILRKETGKLIKKYSKKYSGTELRNRVYASLVSKGFTYDNIFAIINEMEL